MALMRDTRGFTLIEMNLAVIIVGVMAAVLVSLYSVSSKAFVEIRVKNKANSLAIAAMEDIKCRKWDETEPAGTKSAIGRDPGETAGDKTTFDDIDDFNGYSESPPRYQDGTPMPGLDGFSMTVDTVCYVDTALNFSATGTTLKEIVLTVKKGNVPKITLSTIVSQQ